MHLPVKEARRFVKQYQSFLEHCLPRPVSAERLADYAHNPLLALADARARYDKERGLLDAWLASGGRMDDDIYTAITGMYVGRWIYLKDTSHYSLLLRVEENKITSAYATWGLTERLRDIVGESGWIIDAGVMTLGGRYVSDGLISPVAMLGPGIRRDLQHTLTRLRQSGLFYREAS